MSSVGPAAILPHRGAERAVTSIRTRLAGSFGGLILVAGLIIGVAAWAVGSLLEGERDVSGRAMPYLTGLSDAALAAKAAANDERGFLLTGEQKFVDEVRQRRGVQRAALDRARAAAADEGQRAAVDRIAAGLDAFNASLDEEFALYAADRDAAMAISTGRNRDLRKAYEKEFDVAIILAQQHVAEVAAVQERNATLARAALFVLLGVMVAVGTLLAWLLGRAVVLPLAAQVAVLERAARGDLTGRARVQGAREFRRMARATNEMLDATGRAVATIAGSADTLGATAAQLAGASQEIAGATGGAARQAEEVSAAAGQVSMSVHTVAVAADQMGGSVREIAGSAASAAAVATEAVLAAEAAKGTVGKLDESSAEIDIVVKTITSIAEQTNLLALNATIEAARAGDAGRGFAVVAGEVKDLAQETARATGDIAHRVEAIQRDTRQAIDAISRIASVIAQINDHQSIIASTVEEQAATTQEMSRSISEAAVGATSIAENIGAVAQTVTATTAETDRAREAADALAGMGAQLSDLVGRFRY